MFTQHSEIGECFHNLMIGVPESKSTLSRPIFGLRILLSGADYCKLT